MIRGSEFIPFLENDVAKTVTPHMMHDSAHLSALAALSIAASLKGIAAIMSDIEEDLTEIAFPKEK